MKIREIYNISKRNGTWDFYGEGIMAPDILDAKNCKEFIEEYIEVSEKSDQELFNNIKELFKNHPNRLSHIVSTFFLGLWLFKHKKSKFLHESIVNELKDLKCFSQEDEKVVIEEQFTFVWFMATLFHDLGYPAEENGIELPKYEIPCKKNSVPDFYADVYENYYEYRENKEHGIYAGLTFDRDICIIRKDKSKDPKSKRKWDKKYEELYHYVAWIILSHNIYVIRDNEEREKLEAYNHNGLNKLIWSSEKDENGQYKEYKISFDKFPLFTFFCIIDTIEPLKSTSCLSNVDIQLKGKKIIIKSNDSVYRQKVLGLKDWLLPVYEESGVVTIYLTPKSNARTEKIINHK